MEKYFVLLLNGFGQWVLCEDSCEDLKSAQKKARDADCHYKIVGGCLVETLIPDVTLLPGA